MKENHYTDVALKIMNEHGLIANGWSFRIEDIVDNDSNALGVCNYRFKYISIQRSMVHDCDDLIVIDTIKHEIAHSIAGAQAGHGRVWKMYARMLGANPRATAKVSALGEEYNKKNNKYELCIVENGVILERLNIFQKRRSNMSGKYVKNRPDTTDKLHWIEI